MDEELDGINPNSFFEQLTEVRETAQSAQKISNSNLSLLNELRSKVEIISNDLRLLKNEAKDKAFEEEDRKQKEKLENRAKSIAGESQGSGEDIEKEQEDPEKGLLGQIGDFISNLFGGIVGGVAGLAISGIGGLIDLGTRAASSAKRIGTGIADALTFNMFDFDGKGKPDKKNLSSIMGGDKDYEKNRKKNLDLKNEIKDELKEDNLKEKNIKEVTDLGEKKRIIAKLKFHKQRNALRKIYGRNSPEVKELEAEYLKSIMDYKFAVEAGKRTGGDDFKPVANNKINARIYRGDQNKAGKDADAVASETTYESGEGNAVIIPLPSGGGGSPMITGGKKGRGSGIQVKTVVVDDTELALYGGK